jgi:3-dehydroquinate dehydratase-1
MELHAGPYTLGETPLIAGIVTDRDMNRLDDDALQNVDIIELRVDMFDNVTIDQVRKVFTFVRDQFGKPILATVRRRDEGGVKDIPDRRELYRSIIPLSDLVDIEIASRDLFPEIRTLCSTFKKILIGSFHDFDETPADDVLDRIIGEGKSLGADIVKIAVRADNREDLHRLFALTSRHKDKNLITIAMGDQGLPSRIFAPLLGSLLTYGYLNTQSAPGQLSAAEMMSIFRKLKLR